MKYTATAISLLTLLSTSAAQSLNDVPECASQAALKSFTSSGCAISDPACICRNQNFLDSLLPVVREACSPEEFQRTVDFTRQFCGNAGVDLAIPTSSVASPAATDSTTPTTVAVPSAAASNGTMTPGNSTEGGAPQSPDPTPQPAPGSGVAGLVGLAKNAGVLGVVVMGAVMVL
ncbi:MAG: hypothetical protein L6R42_006428 [Xanthoria sp. 1 TBL-2021]|nr:MAG: hypothetical protein L6R42_006428 [Xanthoria sp. 1 TBL-2021]